MITIELRHVAVLLAPDEPRLEQVEMPAFLGTWVRGPVFETQSSSRGKRSRIGPPQRRPSWRFELSEAGIAWAAEWTRISDAANESMRTYLEGEHANCFPGAFRDGFARGSAWARRESGDTASQSGQGAPVKSQTIRTLETAIADALEAMRETADTLEEDDDLQSAHYLRHRIDALGEASSAFTLERIVSMSEAELREEMAADGLDYDECGERGHALVQRLCEEHRKRSEERRELGPRWARGEVTGEERVALLVDVNAYLTGFERHHESHEPWEPEACVALSESFGISLEDAGRLFDEARDGAVDDVEATS
jgi:hypothetical protein